MVAKLKSNRVSLSFLEQGGFLDEVIFDKKFAPLHVAPWSAQKSTPALPVVLQYLRGDFFCAPFGASDIISSEEPSHGASANGYWKPKNLTPSAGTWTLDEPIMGAVLEKSISLQEGHPVVYQTHTFTGGDGRIPVAHHLMLKATSPLVLSFSKYRYIGTPPEPVETDSIAGRSLLAYNTTFDSLEKTKLANGDIRDLSIYPSMKEHEDLLMLSSHQDIPFGWSAAVCPKENWIWFAIKDPNTLPSTTLWMSNGGRYYPPFNGNHLSVIGIEECLSYYHLGHKASISKNPLLDQGIPTCLQLGPEKHTINYAFGVVQKPQNFEKVTNINMKAGYLEISAIDQTITVPFDSRNFPNKKTDI